MPNAGFCCERTARCFALRGSSVRSSTASVVRPATPNVASEKPVAQRNGDDPHPSRLYARRSPVPECAGPTRRHWRVASTSPDARRRRRCFAGCATICLACTRSTTSASRASRAPSIPSSPKALIRSSPSACWSTASPASAAMPARTSICSRSPASTATSARVATPSAL